jgi:hypothetical protein
MIKPNPTSESKRGCCFVTYATAAEAEAAIAALNSCVCSELHSLMPLLVRVADPPRSRDEQRSRSAAQHAQQRGMAAQMGVLPSWGGALGYGWPPQQQGAYAAGQPPFYLAQHGAAAAASGAAAAQYMGVFPGAYGFGMLPQFAAQVGDWSEHADGDGNKYYYNSQTGVSQWEPPSHWQAQQAQQQQQLPIMYPYAQPLPGCGAARRALRSAPCPPARLPASPWRPARGLRVPRPRAQRLRARRLVLTRPAKPAFSRAARWPLCRTAILRSPRRTAPAWAAVCWRGASSTRPGSLRARVVPRAQTSPSSAYPTRTQTSTST